MTEEKALLNLEAARAEHDRLTLASARRPRDPEVQRALRRIVADGRAAWRWYQAAGTGADLPGVVPEAFTDEA